MFVDLIYNEITQEYEASYPSIGTPVTFGTSLGSSSFPSALFGSGASGAPSIAFTAEPTLGFWRNSASNVTLDGNLNITLALGVGATSAIGFGTRAYIQSPANSEIVFLATGGAIGTLFKFDTLPTISSGFGTSPAVTAGSTPMAGSINVGTGGAATTGVILWNGTAFPSTPFIAVTCSLGAVPTVAVATTTQVTFTTSVAWPASTIVNWIVISART